MTPKKNPAGSMRYVGNGAFVPGIPTRDLTADEWQALPAELREQAIHLYSPVETDEVNHGTPS